MYRLVIVEDEEIIRTGLERTINWNAYGFQVVGSASGGHDALAQLDSWKPDAVITDISMPDMDGLTLLEKIKHARPEVEVLLLSSYAQFSYAQKGVQLNAFAYLLKTDLYRDVEQIFRSLAGKLSRRDTAGTPPPVFPTARWLRDGLIPDGIPSFRYGCSCAARGICPEQIPFAGFYPEQQSADLLGVLLADSPDTCRINMERLQKWMTGHGILLFWGTVFTAPGDASSSYFEAAQKRDISGLQGITYHSSFDPGTELMALACGSSEDSFAKELEQYFLALISSEKILLPEYRSKLLHIVEQLLSIFCPEEEPRSNFLMQAMEQLQRSDSMTDITRTITALCTELYRYHQQRSSHIRDYVQTAETFIKNNLEIPFTLNDMAGYLHLSPNYFSSLFKRVKGESFSLFVQKMRIEKAASLAAGSTMKTAQIAQACGFQNERYLARLFKQYYGVPLSVYRSQNRK